MLREYDGSTKGTDLRCLFELIIKEIPGPAIDAMAPLRMQVTNIDYNDYVGRIAIGRIFAGTIQVASLRGLMACHIRLGCCSCTARQVLVAKR